MGKSMRLSISGHSRRLLRLAVLSVVAVATLAHSWLPEQFPDPGTPPGSKPCGLNGTVGLMCDPDSLMSHGDVGALNDQLMALIPATMMQCGDDKKGVQMAVAVMAQMNSSITAAKFAADLRTLWGIGYQPVSYFTQLHGTVWG